MRITADEARKLSGLTAQEEVDAIYPLIREAATKGEKSILITTEFWKNEGERVTAKFAEAIGILRADGFVAEWYSEKVFSDIGLFYCNGLLVHW